MLPLARGEKQVRDWTGGCITKSNPLETAGHAGPKGKSKDSQPERSSNRRTKPPAVALVATNGIQFRTEEAEGSARDAQRSTTVTPISAGSAAITKKISATEDPAMPATAKLFAFPPAIEPAPVQKVRKSRSEQNRERLEASRTAAAAARQAQRDQIVLENLPLVKAIAVRVHENLPVHVDLDDLVHAGILGLFDAATKYDPDKMVSFSSYAKHRIKGAILDSLRQLDWASRDLRRRHKQLEAATRELAGELHRAPSEAELAQKMGVDVDRWRQMMVDLRNVGLVSASQRSADQDELPAPDFPAAAELQPDNMCSLQQLRSALGVAMKSLPERYQKVVALYYTNELTMKEIGGMLGINESRVSQIHKTALEKMAVVLQEAGIRSSTAF
jgi:RNA polymerase sigma factor FliA